MTKLKTTSPHWDIVEAPCEYAAYCGGCKTQNLAYAAQLRAKEQQVHGLVTNVGKFSNAELESLGIMKPIVPCDIQFHYRNKVNVFLIAVAVKGEMKRFVFNSLLLCRWSSHSVLENGCLKNHFQR